MARGRERNFEYYIPTYEDTVKLAEKRTTFISLFKDVKLFRAKQGNNLIRILPGIWPGARHYGLFIKVHRNVGPRDQQYLCLRQNSDYLPKGVDPKCPICDAISEMGANGSDNERRNLYAGEVAVYYVIDRDNEREGIQVWQTSNKNSLEISTQSTDERKKSVLNITDVYHGYDLEFKRTGQGLHTRYLGFHVAREATPLSDDDRTMDRWLDDLFDRPLPSVLNFYSYDHILADFSGRVVDDAPRRSSVRTLDEDEDRLERRRTTDRRRDEDEEEEPEERPRRSRQVEEDEEPPRRPRRVVEEEEEPPPPRRRSQLSEDLDDEVPSDGGRRATSNGRDEEEPEERARPRRARMTEPEESEEENDRAMQRARDRLRLRREQQQEE